MGVKLHLLRGISSSKNRKSLEPFLVSKCVVELSQVAKVRNRGVAANSQDSGEDSEKRQPPEYTCVSKCALLFLTYLPLSPQTLNISS